MFSTEGAMIRLRPSARQEGGVSVAGEKDKTKNGPYRDQTHNLGVVCYQHQALIN